MKTIKNISRYTILSLAILASPVLANEYKDANPNKIIKEDMTTLKNFDKTLYNIADSSHKSLSIPIIYRFISSNRAMINDYSKLIIKGVARIGSRTRRAYSTDDDSIDAIDSIDTDIFDDRQYYRVEIQASYPLYDMKTEKTIRNERIVQNGKILERISLYVTTTMTLSLLHEELKIVRLIQIRDKALVKTGMKYLDERIKTIERLHKIRAEIATNTIKKDKLKQILLDLTTDPVGLSKFL